MKKLTTISLFIFWMVMTAILSASLFYYQNNKDSQKNNYIVSGTNTNVVSNTDSVVNSEAAAIKAVGKSLTIEEVAKHNTASDCWLLIEGKIYSVASYIAAHPGGAGTIIPTCGTDATKAYNTKNGNDPHSGNAHALLANYYIGDLNQIANPTSLSIVSKESVKQAVVTPIVPKTNTVGLSLNMTEIAKHNTRGNCWLLISNKVYNVTSYIIAHPGGAGTIVPTCGTDSTKAYATKNGNSPHSSNAHTLLAAYYIGDLNQQTTVEQVQQNVQTTNTITPPTTRGDDDEEEDDDD